MKLTTRHNVATTVQHPPRDGRMNTNIARILTVRENLWCWEKKHCHW